jgi:hypothetical protein
MREQDGFEAHAHFMDKPADERFILAGGPLENAVGRRLGGCGAQ